MWALPGSSYSPRLVRCTYEGCMFAGSHKVVEVHRMDRHLIYPPGWDSKKHEFTWDADPSLKGKHVPIQGTNITLDSPEVLDAWIAERKRRWPSAQRVEEKKRRREEAVARGQIFGEDMKAKRSRLEGPAGGRYERGRGRGRGGTRGSRGAMQRPSAPRVVQKAERASDDESPEVVSSKAPPGTVDAPPQQIPPENAVKSPPQRKVMRQPKNPPHNPFASRPSLLRNLLLPEIRMTVSNLSQAIHFLVDNDFLRDVELKAGDADNKRIVVL